MTLWPLEAGVFGLDATWQGASGYSIAESHHVLLSKRGMRHSLRQEMTGGWTIRLGPVPRALALQAVEHFTGAPAPSPPISPEFDGP